MAWTLPLSLPVLPSLELLETHSERLVKRSSDQLIISTKAKFHLKPVPLLIKVQSQAFTLTDWVHWRLIWFIFQTLASKWKDCLSFPFAVSLRIDKSNKPKITVACNSQATLTSIFIIPTNRSLFNLTRVSSKEIVFNLDISGSSKGHWEFSAHPPNIVDYVTFM